MDKPENLPQDIGTAYREIREVFDEWVPCEIENHEKSDWHGGVLSGGEFYTIKKCPACGDAATRLVCKEYADMIREYIAENTLVSCMDCGCTAPISAFFGPIVSRKPLG